MSRMSKKRDIDYFSLNKKYPKNIEKEIKNIISFFPEKDRMDVRDFEKRINWEKLSCNNIEVIKLQTSQENFHIRSEEDIVPTTPTTPTTAIIGSYINPLTGRISNATSHIRGSSGSSSGISITAIPMRSLSRSVSNDYFSIDNLSVPLRSEITILPADPVTNPSQLVTNPSLLKKKNHLSESFIRYFYNKLDWGLISSHQTLSEKLIREFHDKVDWYSISCHQKLSKSFIGEFKDEVSWEEICCHQKLSESFIREFQDRVSWNHASMYQRFSEKFIIEFQDKVSWYYIPIKQKVSNKFLLAFMDKVDWTGVFQKRKMSERFIMKVYNCFNSKLDHKRTKCWVTGFSACQKLSEKFIRKHKDIVDWSGISRYQKLSEEFIEEFIDKVDFYYIQQNAIFPEFSIEFVLKYHKKVDWSYIQKHFFIKKEMNLKIVRDTDQLESQKSGESK